MDLDRFKVHSLEQLDLVSRKIALEAFRGVILKTPVKSGRARGNWQCTIGSPATDITDRSDQIPVKVPGGAAFAEVATIGRNWKALSGVSILLTNNLPYIGRLEHGTSIQAPVGMVAVTIAELGGIVQEATP